MTNGFHNNAIFWVEVDRIKSNPFQPRKDFDQTALQSLADSIKQYGVLQPLVVTRKEEDLPDGGVRVFYELVAGERRLRASKLAGITQVPVLIRSKEDSDREKLEIAIIENLQREDLNPIDKAHAFKQLNEKFKMTHAQIAKKMGKSREYISNALRLLTLPDYIQNAIAQGEISEGHARPLLMLLDRPDELRTLFQEIMLKKLTVREAVHIARSVAVEKVRKNIIPPEIRRIEMELMNNLGTRVRIEQKTENAGRIHIDFTNKDDLMHLVELVKKHKEKMLVPSVKAKKEAMEKLGASMGMDMQNATVAQENAEEQQVNDLSNNHSNTESVETNIRIPDENAVFPDFISDDNIIKETPIAENTQKNETEIFNNKEANSAPEETSAQNENGFESTFPEPVKLAQDSIENDIQDENPAYNLQSEVDKIMDISDTDTNTDPDTLADEKLHAFAEKIESINSASDTSDDPINPDTFTSETINEENTDKGNDLYGINDFSQDSTNAMGDNTSSYTPNTPLSQTPDNMSQISPNIHNSDDRAGGESAENNNINTV